MNSFFGWFFLLLSSLGFAGVFNGGQVQPTDGKASIDLVECLKALNAPGVLMSGEGKIIPESKTLVVPGKNGKGVTVFTPKSRVEVDENSCQKSPSYQGSVGRSHPDGWSNISDALSPMIESMNSHKHSTEFNQANAMNAAKLCAQVEDYGIKEAARKMIGQLGEGSPSNKTINRKALELFKNHSGSNRQE